MKRFFENEPVITLNNFAGINWKKFRQKRPEENNHQSCR